MFRSKNYYERDGFLDFLGWLFDVVCGVVGLVLGIVFVIAAVATILMWIFAGPECRARGEKMGIDVSWEFSTGCMIRLNNQWLPWSEVVPVERDGKIVFTTKPHVRLDK